MTLPCAITSPVNLCLVKCIAEKMIGGPTCQLSEPKVTSTLLKTRRIYDMLDGDAQFRSDELGEDVSLSYQSGPMLVEVLNRFGLPAVYGSASRWMYVEELINHCIERQQIPKIFTYFFDLRGFHKDLQGLGAEKIGRRHKAIVEAAIGAINGELLFSGYELRRCGSSYSVAPIDSSLAMETPSIKRVDRPYVKDMAETAQGDINRGEYDSALTKARTLLEEVFCQVIERKGEKPSSSGDINKLFNQVKNLYNIYAGKNTDRRVCDLVNVLNKIVESIAQMRNTQSDAHGVGVARVNIESYHARLAVNAAANVADFMLSVANRAESRQGQRHL